MDDPEISEFDKSRQEYDEEMFEIKHFVTPSEIRSIIATRRIMEERIGTNGSIELTMKIASSVHDCMKALNKHQVKRQKDLIKQMEQEAPDDEDEEDLEDEE